MEGRIGRLRLSRRIHLMVLMGRELLILMWKRSVELLLLFGGLVLARPRGFCGLRDMLRRQKHLCVG